jgi:hypothetical protein
MPAHRAVFRRIRDCSRRRSPINRCDALDKVRRKSCGRSSRCYGVTAYLDICYDTLLAVLRLNRIVNAAAPSSDTAIGPITKHWMTTRGAFGRSELA